MCVRSRLEEGDLEMCHTPRMLRASSLMVSASILTSKLDAKNVLGLLMRWVCVQVSSHYERHVKLHGRHCHDHARKTDPRSWPYNPTTTLLSHSGRKKTTISSLPAHTAQMKPLHITPKSKLADKYDQLVQRHESFIHATAKMASKKKKISPKHHDCVHAQRVADHPNPA